MQLKKFDPMPEAFTPEGKEPESKEWEGVVFTLRCLTAPQLAAVHTTMAQGLGLEAERLAIQHGIQSVAGLTDASGKEVTDGLRLWFALADSGGLEAVALIQTLVTKIIIKSSLDETTAKNSESSAGS